MGEQHAGFIGSARAAAGEHYADTLLVPRPLRIEVSGKRFAESFALAFKFKTD